jgi:hypothetical protein
MTRMDKQRQMKEITVYIRNVTRKRAPSQMFTFTVYAYIHISTQILFFFYHIPEHPAAENPKKPGRH